MRNVLFRPDERVALEITHLRGEMVPISPNAHPVLGDARSFVVRLREGGAPAGDRGAGPGGAAGGRATPSPLRGRTGPDRRVPPRPSAARAAATQLDLAAPRRAGGRPADDAALQDADRRPLARGRL